MARWLCECERTNAEGSADCWSCGRPRPTTTDDVVARLTAEVERLTAERDEARGLLVAILDGEYVSECPNAPACDDETEPLDDPCSWCRMRARIAAHLEGR